MAIFTKISSKDILLIGHKNHPEVIGTMGQIPRGEIDLIENIDDVNNYQIKQEVDVDIKEVEIIKENIVFKTPGKLN